MTLHVPTLMVTLIAGFALLSLQLALADRRIRRRKDLRLWATGSALLVAGLVCLTGRDLLPVWMSVYLGNLFTSVGFACFSAALWQRLERRTLSIAQAAAGVVVLMIGLAPLSLQDIGTRTWVMSVLDVLLMLPGTWIVLRRGWSTTPSLRTVAVSLLLASAALALRAVDALRHPENYTSIFQPSLGQTALFMVGFLALITAGFGFVLSVLEEVAQSLEQLAAYDSLTDCLNRRTLDELLAHELERGRREMRPVGYLLLDLDHFKVINDVHGHRTGDHVLRRFADAVRSRVRASDVLGRLGGEEFGLVLPGTDAVGALQVAEELRATVEALTLSAPDGSELHITVSAGVAIADPDRPTGADALYGLADQALYAAKRGGRNRVVLHGAPQAPVPQRSSDPAATGS